MGAARRPRGGLRNHRFSGIREGTGAPRDRLAARLRELVAAGVLERRQYQQSPVRFDYHLTRAGRELLPVLRALMSWGDRWAVDEPPMTLLHRDHQFRRARCAATAATPCTPATCAGGPTTGRPRRPAEPPGQLNSARPHQSSGAGRPRAGRRTPPTRCAGRTRSWRPAAGCAAPA